MKKKLSVGLTMIAMIFSFFVFVSCSDDDDSNNYKYRSFAKIYMIDLKQDAPFTADMLTEEVTKALSQYDKAINVYGFVDPDRVGETLDALKAEWIERGWYDYFSAVIFKIGYIDTETQEFHTPITWTIGKNVHPKI